MGRKKNGQALRVGYGALSVLPIRAFQASLGHDAQIFISVSSFCLSGGNAVVSKAGEEGIDKKELFMSGLAQGGLDQGEGAQGEVAEGEQAQEEPAPLSPAQGASGGGEEGENKEGEMEGNNEGEIEGRHAGDGASGPEDDNIQEEAGPNGDEQPPQQEAAIPEGMRNPQAGNCLAHQRTRRTRFTHSQLRDLERLFQENRFPSLRVR